MSTLADKLAAVRNHAKGPDFAAKLRAQADRIAPVVEQMRVPPTWNPTPKRNCQHAHKMIEADQLERAAAALHALASAHAEGFVPAVLAGIKTKADVLPLVRHVLDTSGGYYSVVDTRLFADETPRGRALQALLAPPDPAEVRQREIVRRERDLIMTNIPGFFQTPPAVAARMVALARIEPGHDCLEPSAGNGNIADLMPGCDCIEWNWSLRDILALKGHNLLPITDFLLHRDKTYDRILMNPPFENGQDMEHVRHAYELLRPGGTLVAILSGGYTFRKTKQAESFRGWIDAKLDHAEELPAGTFAGPTTITQTQVSARLVVLAA